MFSVEGQILPPMSKVSKESFNSKTTKFKFPVFKLQNWGYFWGSFPEKIQVRYFEIKIYEVCEAKMPLNTYFDAKIVH